MVVSERPLAVTGLNDDDDDEVDENSSGAKRVLARLGVAMARYSSHLLCYHLSPPRLRCAHGTARICYAIIYLHHASDVQSDCVKLA